MHRITDPSELEGLSRDAGVVSITPKLAYVAESEEDVALALVESYEAGSAVTARGGGTSIPTQSVGRGAILMQRRSGQRLVEGGVVCEPGVVKSDLNELVAGAGRWMPVDPSSYASCTVGGMVANNSSGLRTLKYGSTIDYVLGLRVALPGEGVRPLGTVPLEEALSGEGRTKKVASLLVENQKAIAEERPRVTKNSSGYRLERAVHDGLLDLAALLVGSEGTLGVVTETSIRTIQRPKWRLLLVTDAPLDGLGKTVGSMAGLRPSALELVDKSVYRLTGGWKKVEKYSRTDDPYLIFCELDGGEEDQSAAVEEVASSPAAALDPLVFTSSADIASAWEARNGSLTAAQDMRRGSSRPVPGVEDVVVPPERLTDLVSLLTDSFVQKGVEYILYGHAGDANLHARPFLDLDASSDRRALDDLMEGCFEGVWKMRGSMTGEHGDGMLRAPYVERQYPRTYWIMREVKEAFDPRNLLNPGVKLPPGRP